MSLQHFIAPKNQELVYPLYPSKLASKFLLNFIYLFTNFVHNIKKPCCSLSTTIFLIIDIGHKKENTMYIKSRGEEFDENILFMPFCYSKPT